MNWLTDEILFYGGVAASAASFVAAVFYFSISQIQKIRLNTKLDEEYGKKER